MAKPLNRRKPDGEGATSGMTAIKKTTQRQGFKTSEFVVYPAHGVGQIVSIEEQEVAGGMHGRKSWKEVGGRSARASIDGRGQRQSR